jgi:hypothetical protein
VPEQAKRDEAERERLAYLARMQRDLRTYGDRR